MHPIKEAAQWAANAIIHARAGAQAVAYQLRASRTLLVESRGLLTRVETLLARELRRLGRTLP